MRTVDPDRPYNLFVGYDWDRKGGPLVIEAFRRARLSVPRCRLVIVGCTPQLDEDNVDVVGRLTRTEARNRERLFALYAGASVFTILPSFDTFPNLATVARRVLEEMTLPRSPVENR